jgi:hypothetical protein
MMGDRQRKQPWWRRILGGRDRGATAAAAAMDAPMMDGPATAAAAMEAPMMDGPATAAAAMEAPMMDGHTG